MTFEDLLAHVIEVLQREKRISYRALQRRFDLDDACLDDVKVELIEAKQLARDENGRILVWAEKAATTALPPTQQEITGSLPTDQAPQEASAPVAASPPRPSAASSQCCSATSPTPPTWHGSSILKTSGR
jgi:hypothetical protein